MSYVIQDKQTREYVSKVTDQGLTFTDDIQKAKVYKTTAGVLNAIGVPDKSFKTMGKWPPSKKLKIPAGMEMISVDIAEGQVQNSPYKGLEVE